MNLNEINIEYINKFQYILYMTCTIWNNNVYEEYNHKL